MDYQNVFKRHEIKYMLDERQYQAVRDAMQGKTEQDEFAKSSIRNIYYDTPDFRLIRRSLEKPAYKEKLRVRSYGGDKVFVELKKKYHSVVYKRRIALGYDDAITSLESGAFNPSTQITNEIEYFLKFYKTIRPAVYISYDRISFKCKDDETFRITFDTNILWHTDDFDLKSKPYGSPILDDSKVLLELKTQQAIPLWLVETLSREKIYKTSFSKYGAVYEQALRAPANNSRQIADTAAQTVKQGELIYV